MKIRLVKINKPSKWKYQVLKVTTDRKYKYYVITTKIYHHEIIETIPFAEVDYIECYEDKGNVPVKVVRPNEE